MIRRFVNGFLDTQTWADGLGETLQKVYLAILGPVPPIKDILHGTWLGHALHPSVTDIPIGALSAALVLDLIGMNGAPGVLEGAHWATLIGFVGLLGSAVTGIADYTGTYGKDRRYGTIHSLFMFATTILYLFSVLIRFGTIAGAQQTAFTTSVIGWLLLIAGAFIGGEISFGTGYMVDRHAWEEADNEWRALDKTDFPEGQPVKAMAGDQPILVVRHGATTYAIHDTCSHAGCSLSEGKLVKPEKIECGCHGSWFDLRTGKVGRGPATYDQPRYDVRTRDGRVEVRRVTSPQSQHV